MPCDQLRETVVDLTDADEDILRKALEDEGYKSSGRGSRYYYNNEGDSCTLGPGGPTFTADTQMALDKMVNRVKNAYAVRTITTQAERYGWKAQRNGSHITLTKGADNMEVDVLPGGIVKVVTDPISAPNHMNADRFLADLARGLGGETTVTRRLGKKTIHTHQEEEIHATDS